MSKPVMSVARILRPYQGFEYYYGLQGGQSIPGDQPIRLQPVNPTLINRVPAPPVDPYAFDEAARQAVNGYSPRLGAMLPMSSLGSMVLVYLPQIPYVNEAIQGATPFVYSFVPVWRMRTIADWRRSRKQGNIPLERFGAPDTTVGAAGDRYIIPACRGAAIYMRPEPTTTPGVIPLPANIAHQMAYPEGVGMATGSTASTWRPPIAPTTAGGVDMFTQQGVVDAAVGSGDGAQPFFRPYWIKVCGNELSFDVYKLEVPTDPTSDVTYRAWDFQYVAATGYCDTVAPGEDLPFSMIFGCGAHPGVSPTLAGDHLQSGVYVSNGVV